jgi:4-amino-4-deoxy-L-arabinose transferase-like glycosyltransferase
MRPFRWHWVVLFAAALVLGWNLWNVGIASGYIDPLLHFGAQDEATYTREAITMARDGGWMTPTFLGRWVFEKPPLLMWLSALSMKLFGIGRLTARLPVVFAGALICALCFAIVRRVRGTAAGLAAAAMALSSQILFTMSRHNMTDILLAASGMCAFAVLLKDPHLRSPRAFTAFVIAAGAGIMAKSVAGLLVLAVMAVVVQNVKTIALAGIATIAIASSWFLYNFLLHREWFLADMGFQLITIGTAVHQTSQENHVWFYLLRILVSDAIPFLLALTGLPALVASVRRREAMGLLAASYLVIYFAALMVFRFHSQQYLCWFVPSLILIAGFYSPLLNGRLTLVVTAVIAVVFGIKLSMPDSSFGVSIRSGTTLAAAPVLSQYCTQHRATRLYILGVDDEFYSASLPLAHVRYGWIDAADLVAREHPHLAHLGILIPASDLQNLNEKLPLYRDRLRAWGLDSVQAVATGISARDVEQLRKIVRDHPESDFLVARSVLPEPGKVESHNVTFVNGEFALLESKTSPSPYTPGWTCEM